MDRRALSLVIMLLCPVLAGCGTASNGRFPVSGQVTLKGSPLKTGTIEFEATDGSHRSGSTVDNGRYTVPATQGLLPGTYVVKVSAIESSQSATAGPPGPESMGAEQSNRELIPAQFNRESKLTHEAGPGKPGTFDVKIP